MQAGTWKGELTNCAPNRSSGEAIPQHSHGICACFTHAECLLQGPIVNWLHKQAGELGDESPGLGRVSEPIPTGASSVILAECPHHP